ncbi:MAG: lipopolysaccharide biosynthesis protein [Lachnospiraceae bacterium]
MSLNSNRIKNAKRNAIWGIVNRVITILLPFLTRTVLIYVLGVEYVGINDLFSSILQVLSLAELGFSSAIIYNMYKPLADGDNIVVCALLQFYKKIYRCIGCLVMAIGIALIPFLKYLISGSCPSDVNIYVVYLIYLLNTSCSYFLFAYKKSLLTAVQRQDIISKVAMLNKIISSFVQIVGLLVLRKYYIFIIVAPVMALVDNLLCQFVAKRYYPQIECRGVLEKKYKDDIIEKTKGLLIHKICGVTRNSCDNIFISMFLGLTPVGIYSNYYYVMSSIRGVLDVFTVSMSASVGNSVAVESIEKNYKNLNLFTFIYEWLCGWCTVCLLCLYQPFMRLWVGEKAMFSFDIVIAICIYFYVWTIGDIKSQYADAAGLWWKDRIRASVEAISNIALNYVLVKHFAVLGIVIATAISILFIGFPWSTKIVFDNYFKEKSFLKYMRDEMLYAIVTVFSCTITWNICENVKFIGFAELIVKALICIVLPNFIYIVCYIKTKYFKDAMGFARRIVFRT